MNDLTELSIVQLLKELRKKSISARDIISSYYKNILRYEQKIQAFIHLLNFEDIEDYLKQVEKKRNSVYMALFSLPYSLKDSYCTKGIYTTAGSKVLGGFKPQYNATVYQKLIDKGAILFGKNSQDAWGHGSTSENTDFQIPKNPWDLNRVSGGSSGGSAAGIASSMIAFAIGEDTGGSIRNPASFCNIVGLKVTYGRVSRYGCIAYASSLDTVGPMAKSVADISIVLASIGGKDPLDASSSFEEVPNYSQSLTKGVKNKRLGIPKEFFQAGTSKEVISKVKEAIRVFERLGVNIIEVSLPSIDIGVAAYYLLAPSETSSNLARYDGIRYGKGRNYFTKESMRRILIGTYALSAGYYDAYYKKALKARTLIRKDYQKAFDRCDFMVAPVTPTTAPYLGEIINDPIQLMLSDVYTLTQNIAGIPSLALPCGFSSNGLPIGMQIMGKMFSESLLLQAGYAYQQNTNWHKQKPKL